MSRLYRVGKAPLSAVYIGRGTPWGNPFPIGKKYGDRDQVVARYWRYLRHLLHRHPTLLEPLRGKDLVCHCYPQRCHGEAILYYLRRGARPMLPPGWFVFRCKICDRAWRTKKADPVCKCGSHKLSVLDAGPVEEPPPPEKVYGTSPLWDHSWQDNDFPMGFTIHRNKDGSLGRRGLTTNEVKRRLRKRWGDT